MEARIIGLKGCGKSTLLGALSEGRAEHAITTVKMGDVRIRTLSDIFHPKKTTFSEFQVKEVLWPEASGRKGEMDRYLDAVSGGQVFLHVIRAFESPLLSRSADAERDLRELDEQFQFADLLAIERAFERARKQPMADNVKRVLVRAREALEADTPLRELGLDEGELGVARNYQFLTLVPQLLLVNVGEAGETDGILPPEAIRDRQVLAFPFTEALEVARLSPEEQLEFAEALGLPGPAADLVTHAAFGQMGYISFFTVGEDEVRAWPVHRGESARRAAGVIHSDLERGFIRAEVVSYDDFLAWRSMKACREHGVLKIEGKDYVVQDGDILHVRFNV